MSYDRALRAEYLYIDDDADTVRRYADAVMMASPCVSIVVERPISFDGAVTHLREWIAARDGMPRGIILDWRLNEFANEASHVDYQSAATLAQDLRTAATDRAPADVPITLWSTRENLKPTYYPDNTPKDLFDRTFDKDTLLQNASQTGTELCALAEGYAYLREALATKEVTPNRLLGLDEAVTWLDDRAAFALYPDRDEPPRVHVVAGFILQELIMRPGPLLSEGMLAARLGVAADAKDWPALLERFEPYQYQGPFSSAWPRWWTLGIQRWIAETVPTLKPLNALIAPARVEAIKKATALTGLRAAEPIEVGASTRFSTLCAALDLPLDHLDGVRVFEPEPEAWQEARYLSIKAVRERDRMRERGLKVHPLDRRRALALAEVQTADNRAS
jgi:hypothetical protein